MVRLLPAPVCGVLVCGVLFFGLTASSPAPLAGRALDRLFPELRQADDAMEAHPVVMRIRHVMARTGDGSEEARRAYREALTINPHLPAIRRDPKALEHARPRV